MHQVALQRAVRPAFGWWGAAAPSGGVAVEEPRRSAVPTTAVPQPRVAVPTTTAVPQRRVALWQLVGSLA